MSLSRTYLRGCDLVGAQPEGTDYLVVHIRDLPGLLKAPIVRDKVGAFGGLAQLFTTVAPSTASGVLYSGLVQKEIDGAIRDQGLAPYLDAHFTSTPPADRKPPPTEFINGAVIGAGGAIGLAGIGYGLFRLIGFLTRKGT